MGNKTLLALNALVVLGTVAYAVIFSSPAMLTALGVAYVFLGIAAWAASFSLREPYALLSNFELLKEWHEYFGVPVNSTPTFPDDRTVTTRLVMLDEEVAELKDAISQKDLVAVADAIGDILFITYGAADEFGMDADAIFEEVTRSNWTKLAEDGTVLRRDDGKILKGPNFEEPKLAEILGVN